MVFVACQSRLKDRFCPQHVGFKGLEGRDTVLQKTYMIGEAQARETTSEVEDANSKGRFECFKEVLRVCFALICNPKRERESLFHERNREPWVGLCLFEGFMKELRNLFCRLFIERVLECLREFIVYGVNGLDLFKV